MNCHALEAKAIELADRCVIEENTGAGPGWKWGVLDALEAIETNDSKRLSKQFTDQLIKRDIIPKYN